MDLFFKRIYLPFSLALLDPLEKRYKVFRLFIRRLLHFYSLHSFFLQFINLEYNTRVDKIWMDTRIKKAIKLKSLIIKTNRINNIYTNVFIVEYKRMVIYLICLCVLQYGDLFYFMEI